LRRDVINIYHADVKFDPECFKHRHRHLYVQVLTL
jgi:hypothetical protein